MLSSIKQHHVLFANDKCKDGNSKSCSWGQLPSDRSFLGANGFVEVLRVRPQLMNEVILVCGWTYLKGLLLLEFGILDNVDGVVTARVVRFPFDKSRIIL